MSYFSYYCKGVLNFLFGRAPNTLPYYIILTTCLPFTDKETKAQRGAGVGQKAHSQTESSGIQNSSLPGGLGGGDSLLGINLKAGTPRGCLVGATQT